MNIIRGAARLFSPRLSKCILASGLSVGVLFASGIENLRPAGATPRRRDHHRYRVKTKYNQTHRGRSLRLRLPISYKGW